MKTQYLVSPKNKRILFYLCVFGVFFSLLAIPAKADTIASGTCGDNLTWTLDDAGTLTISGTGLMNDFSLGSAPWYSQKLTIKNVIISDGVTSIGSHAFTFCTNLSSITIPNSVTILSDYAFWNCEKLTSITIPDNATSIGSSAFASCTNLTSITIPDSVTYIGYYAFSDCTNLTSITISNSVTIINDYAFRNCTNLTSITIPDSVGKISGKAFENCESLTSITIPDSVTSIGDNAFIGCSSLTDIIVDSGNDDYCSVDSVLLNKAETNLICYPAGKTDNAYIIPSSVTCISDSAFYECQNLTSITIPDSVTSIGESAFSSCSSLTSITIPNSVTSIGNDAFSDCWDLTSITIPNSITGIGRYTFFGCFSLTNITIPNSVTSIGDYAFYECRNLTSITIPNSVTSIGYWAFYGCSSLSEVYYYGSRYQWNNMYVGRNNDELLNANITYYIASGTCGDDMTWTLEDEGTLTITGTGEMTNYDSWRNYSPWHSESESITSIIISNCVTSIGDYAFFECGNLTSITIPASVTSIGDNAFIGCSSLTDIIVDSGNDDYCSVDSVLLNKAETNLICYPAGKTDNAYIIPSSVTCISDSAFYECQNLTSITIPDSVTSIGSNSFCSCYGLTSITIPNSVTSIGQGAFSQCFFHEVIYLGSREQWNDIDIGEDNISLLNANIKYYIAFGTCGDDMTWTLEDEGTLTITGTGEMTNYDSWRNYSPWHSESESITSIVISNCVSSIGDYAFYGCENLTSITIPNSVTSIGDSAFSGCSNLTSITIPNSVASIGDYAFYECRNLTSITIPNSVTSIGSYAFHNCYNIIEIYIDDIESWLTIEFSTSYTSHPNWLSSSCHLYIDNIELTNVTIPSSVTNLCDFAFAHCSSLTSVTIPNSVTSIGDYAFSDCSSLTSITIPNSVTSIGHNVFIGCSSLTDIIVDSGNDDYCSVKGVLLNIAETDLICYPTGKTDNAYTIPSSITSIGDYAFFSCSNLTSITVPSSVISIGGSAFARCYRLSSVLYSGTEEKWQAIEIDDNNQYLLSANITYEMEMAEFTVIKNWVDQYDQSARPLSITVYLTGNGITYSQVLSFANDWTAYFEVPKYDSEGNLIQYVWEESPVNGYTKKIEVDGNYITFTNTRSYYDYTVVNYSIPSGVTSIGSGEFLRYPNLNSIMIPESVTDIGNNPFSKNVSVYCYQYSYAHFWAEDNGYTVILVDNGDLSSIMTVTLSPTRTVLADSVSEMGETVFPLTDDVTVSWSSSAPDVAYVNNDGYLIALNPGTATITLSAGGKTAQCIVTVVKEAGSFEIIEDIYVETTKTIQVTLFNIIPSDATLDLNWTTGNTVYATVSQTGLVTGKAVGETTLTVTDTISGLTRIATIHICYPVQTVSLTLANSSVYAGLPTTVTALVTTTKGQSYENKLVTFTSSNTSVATVDQQGNIQTLKAGTVTITATAANGVIASKTLTVKDIQRILALPNNLGEINNEAFAGLTAVEAIRIPEGVYYIADDAFTGTNIIILAPKGSYAAAWALDHGMTVIEE